MRFIIITLISFIAITSLSAQNKNSIDRKYGFRDIKLETPVDEISNLKLIKESNGIQYYIKQDENNKEGDLEFQQILYGFYNNKLYFIVLRTIGVQNADHLLTYLNREYGEGQPNHNIADSYTWFAKKTGLVYEYKEIPGIAEAYLYSKTLLIEKRKAEKP